MSPSEEIRLLVTGAGGFVGGFLIEAAQQRWGKRVNILACRNTLGSRTHWNTNRLETVILDITQQRTVAKTVANFQPTHVVHLAAISHILAASDNLKRLWDINLLGTLHLVEAVRQFKPDCVFLNVSSSETYGHSFKANCHLKETAQQVPRNAYAASKVASEVLVRQYAEHGLKVINARPFNHIGPKQKEDFVASSFAAQIVRIELGLQEPTLKVGNLQAVRDFLDVRDVVQSYLLLLEKAPDLISGSAYNIASGQGRSVQSLLDGLRSHSNANFEVVSNKERARKSDTPFAVGNASQLRTHVDWQPKKDWQTTLKDILDYWRAELTET